MNRIISEKCKTLRALGRNSLLGCWQEAILFVLVCNLITRVPAIVYNFIYEMLPASFDKLGILAYAVNIYGIAITGPISLSLAAFFIKLFRNDGPKNFAQLKFGFHYFGKALILYIRIMLFTWLWSLLFIIPGIIAAISYSQSFFILADDPTKTPAKCMFESKFIMRGNKWKYCMLLLSFIGWYVLAMVPAGITHFVLDSGNMALMDQALADGDAYSAYYYATSTSPIVNVLELLTCAVSAYVYSAKTAFFDILVGRLVVRSADEVSFKTPEPTSETKTESPAQEVATEQPAQTEAEVEQPTETGAAETNQTSEANETANAEVSWFAEAEFAQTVEPEVEPTEQTVEAEVEPTVEAEQPIETDDAGTKQEEEINE